MSKVAKNYSEVVQILNQEAQNHEEIGLFKEAEEVKQVVKELEKWLQGDRTAPCPVDLSSHQIILDEITLPATPSEMPLTSHEPPASESHPDISAPLSSEEVVTGVAAAPEIDPYRLSIEDAPLLDQKDNGQQNGERASELVTPVLKEDPELTIEQKNIDREIDQVGWEWEQKNIREAYYKSRWLVNQTGLTAQQQERIENWYQKLQVEFERLLNHHLKQGEDARTAGNIETAKEAYLIVLDLDPENRAAQQALRQITQEVEEQLSQAQKTKLRSGLRERRDIQQLGNAVYEAEALLDEGKLTDELRQLLTEGRKAYDQIRIAHGNTTTMMRLGDLTARQKASIQLGEAVALGTKEIFDPTVNRFRAAYEVLQEANKLYEQASGESAQHEINLATKALEGRHPIGALHRLERVLQDKAFQEGHKKQLEAKLEEVQQAIANQERSEGLLVSANQEKDPVTSFKLKLEAFSIFKLKGAEEQLALARQTALTVLVARIEKQYQDSEISLDREQYDLAREQIAKTREGLAIWPEKLQPEELQNWLPKLEQLRERINERERVQQSFQKELEQIRKSIIEANSRQLGFDRLKQLMANVLFEPFETERQGFNIEMDQYRGVGDKLAEAEWELSLGHWERVLQLVQDLQRSGKVGQFAEKVRSLREAAQLNLDMERVRKNVREDNVDVANEVLSKLKNNPKNKTKIETELADQIALIEQAIKDTDLKTDGKLSIKELYSQGDRLTSKPGFILEAFLEGLRIFQFIGGGAIQGEIPANWPEYRLSLYTTTARERVKEVAQKIRESLLPSLRAQYKPNQQKKNGEAFSVEEGQRYAKYAAALREHKLLESEEEQGICQWFEISYWVNEANKRADRQEVVEIWQRLNRLFPDSTELRQGLRQAQISYAIQEAGKQKQTEDALSILRQAEEDSLTARSWELALALADVHIARGDFEGARKAVRTAEQYQGEHEKIQQKRTEIEYEVAIWAALQTVAQESQVKESLKLLKNRLEGELLKNSRRLKEKQEELFQAEQKRLLAKGEECLNKEGDVNKIEAVLAFIDLQELETLLHIPENARKSKDRLERLRNELLPVANSVIKEAEQLDITQMALEQALERTKKLSGRLETFIKVIPLFQELRDVKTRIEEKQKVIREDDEQLKKLEDLLKEVNGDSLWAEALRQGEFSKLENYQRQINSLNLNGMLDVRQFYQKLEEWRAAHRYLLQIINNIKRKFSPEEDFKRVIGEIRRSQEIPDVRPDNHRAWQQIIQRDYTEIRAVMGERLRVVDLYSPQQAKQELIGWEEIEKAAVERDEALFYWEQWREECVPLMEKGKSAAERYNDLLKGGGVQVVVQRQVLEELKWAAEVVLKKLEEGPQKDGEIVPALSQKAINYHNESNNQRKYARVWLSFAELQLNSLEQGEKFPSTEEFKQARSTKNWVLMKQLIERAERVGTMNPDEMKVLQTYKRVYDNRFTDQKQPTIFDWIFRRG